MRLQMQRVDSVKTQGRETQRRIHCIAFTHDQPHSQGTKMPAQPLSKAHVLLPQSSGL